MRAPPLHQRRELSRTCDGLPKTPAAAEDAFTLSLSYPMTCTPTQIHCLPAHSHISESIWREKDCEWPVDGVVREDSCRAFVNFCVVFSIIHQILNDLVFMEIKYWTNKASTSPLQVRSVWNPTCSRPHLYYAKRHQAYSLCALFLSLSNVVRILAYKPSHL